VSNSFWDVNTSGLSSSAGGVGKTTKEMRTKSTFTDAGWNFTDVWFIVENVTYPALRWQEVDGPTADAGPDQRVSLGSNGTAKVVLNGTGSIDDFGIMNYTWGFDYNGSEQLLYGSAVEFTFGIPGQYNVTLNVTDSMGKQDTDVVIVTIVDVDPPNFGKDLTPSMATTGDPFFFLIEVLDNVEIRRVMVFYWFEDAGSNYSMYMGKAPLGPPGFYTIGIRAASDSIGALHYQFYAVDNSLNYNITDWKVVPVVDDDQPELVFDYTSDTGYTGDTFWFSFDITDNIGVNETYVEYTYEDDQVVHRVDMDEGASNWSSSITIRSDSPPRLNYTIFAIDEANNTMKVTSMVVNILDNDPPIFVKDSSPDTADTDMSYTFNVSVEDNIGVDTVWVEYWYGNGTVTNASMDLGDTTWEHWMIVEATLDDLHYVIWCNDTSGNVNSTEERTVDVIDINGPQIINRGTKAWATTGDPHEFTITAHDNVGLKRATLWYAFPGDELAPVEMELIEAYPSSGNALYSIFIDVPSDLEGNISYSYEVEDLYGNIHRFLLDIIRVRDDDDPWIVEDRTPGEVGMGEDLTFSVVVSDNVGLLSVDVEYSLADGDPVTAPMAPDGAEDVYSFNIAIAVNETGPISYRFRVMDRGWNEVNGSQRLVSVVDGIPPEILDAIWGESIKGLDLTVVLRARDNMGVDSASLSYRFGDGTETIAEMDENLEAVIPIPRDPAGDLVLVFTVMDAAGNEAMSEEMILPLLNAEPTVDPIPLWEVIEEEDTYLDLAPYLSDANDDVGSLTLTSHFGDVTVEGLVLRTLFVYPLPDHTFNLTVSDGEDETDFQMTIHIVNVNDAPIIVEARHNDDLFDPSIEDVLLRQGTNDTFWVRAIDEDGDDLEYSWVHDGEVVARGQELRYETLHEGTYINLTLVVDDGQDTAEYRIYRTSVLSAEDEGTAIPWWIILIVVIGISMIISVVAVRRFRDGGHRGPSD
jgi:hypothetical protein